VTTPSAPPRLTILFVYGTLLQGESGHSLLDGAAPLGSARTTAAFDLFDLGPYPALVAGGSVAVAGEVYEVTARSLAAIDIHEEVPRLFKRATIELEGGRHAQAYVLERDQVRGRRRIRSGDWRSRFRVDRVPAPANAPFVAWLRKRGP
jgi:gamma-glutamylcyclotransferase (GGCT)/AIG2-like uncharacterized protein YtfP